MPLRKLYAKIYLKGVLEMECKTYTKGGFNYDAVELTLEYQRISDEMEKEVGVELTNYLDEHGLSKESMGICHIYWSIKKQILKEKYGIEWQSPADLNSQVIFD